MRRWYWMTPADTPEEFSVTDMGDFPLVSSAEELQVALSSVEVDDPDGTYDFKGWRRVWFEDDDAPTDQTVIYMGFISDIVISRLNPKVTTSRKWTLTLADLNHVATKRVFRANADRPAETDIERMDWLMSTNYISLANTNLDYQASAPSWDLDARDFENQGVPSMLQDMMEQSGRNTFVLYDEAEGPPTFVTPTTELAVWYNLTGVELYDSAISLSNVLSDIDVDWTDPAATVFAMLDSTSLQLDPTRIYSRIIAAYDGGSLLVEDTDIGDEYANRDVVMSMPNVTNELTAGDRASRAQSEGSEPLRTVKTGYVCTAAHVNALMQGMRFQFKASHLPGYEDFTWIRALNRTVTCIGPDTYQVEVEAVGGPFAPPPGPCSDVNLSDGTVTSSKSGDGPVAPVNPTFTNDGNPATYSEKDSWVSFGPDLGVYIWRSDLGAEHVVGEMTLIPPEGVVDWNYVDEGASRTTVIGGSHDGSSWDTIAATINESTGIVTFDDDETYRYFRIEVSEETEDGFNTFFSHVRIGTWEICGVPA